MEEDDEKPSGLIAQAVSTALVPLHAAVSRPAQRAYLGTFLFATASVLLLCVSSVAYTLFYYNYVPQNSVERVVHLQFGTGPPHSTTPLLTPLTPLQPYDITLSLHLPRTPSNLAAGNFMLDLSLLGPSPTTTTTTTPNNSSAIPLAHSRRPAILPYTSPLVSTLRTLTTLPFYLLNFATESTTLSLTMFESVSFPRGRANMPQSVRLIIESDQKMQVYEVRVQIIAKLGGLRWLLYHHRVLSFIVFTTAFWGSSMLSMGLAWFALSTYFGSGSGPSSSTNPKAESQGTNGNLVKVKRERSDSDTFDPTSMEDLSDTSRTFPTLSRQMPLHFRGRRDVKKEEEIKREEDEVMRSTELQPLAAAAAAEADDEDDDEMSQDTSGFRDSGIGTGFDDDDVLATVRRRVNEYKNRTDGS